LDADAFSPGTLTKNERQVFLFLQTQIAADSMPTHSDVMDQTGLSGGEINNIFKNFFIQVQRPGFAMLDYRITYGSPRHKLIQWRLEHLAADQQSILLSLTPAQRRLFDLTTSLQGDYYLGMEEIRNEMKLVLDRQPFDLFFNHRLWEILKQLNESTFDTVPLREKVLRLLEGKPHSRKRQKVLKEILDRLNASQRLGYGSRTAIKNKLGVSLSTVDKIMRELKLE
jgi:hypothetical protein